MSFNVSQHSGLKAPLAGAGWAMVLPRFLPNVKNILYVHGVLDLCPISITNGCSILAINSLRCPTAFV